MVFSKWLVPFLRTPWPVYLGNCWVSWWEQRMDSKTRDLFQPIYQSTYFFVLPNLVKTLKRTVHIHWKPSVGVCRSHKSRDVSKQFKYLRKLKMLFLLNQCIFLSPMDFSPNPNCLYQATWVRERNSSFVTSRSRVNIVSLSCGK